ncbi:MAG: TonB-dependent receptor [Gemmatimonadaceae bacterium]|nr:TonB-dependent receptor [Gemmatimonadaceae bacterium]
MSPTHRLLLSSFAVLAMAGASPPLQAQGTATVRGSVTSSTASAPVAAAQVFIVGTRLGSASGTDGRYTFSGVPAGTHVVRVRALGYQPTEKSVTVAAGASVTVDFVLNTAPVSLDEVVVTGTAGSARKREVGNSIGQVKVTDAPEVPSSVSQLLTGRLAGVSISGGTGNSGAGSSIRLRGTTSVALSNQPLIYVDGVRTRSDEYPRNGIFTGTTQRGANAYGSPINDINPDDIERIEVVKGAAAATLFGTDAAAGVIQIFTKRGTQGAAKWQTQFNTGYSELQKFGTDSVPLLFMDPFLRKGKRFGMNAQVSGGPGDNLRYLVSGGADNTEGVLPHDRDRKYQIRTNVDLLPFRKVSMSWNSSYTNSLVQQTPAGNNAQGVTLNAFRQNRNYFGNANPDTIRRVLEQDLRSNIDRLILGTTMTATPFTNFSSRFTVGFDRAALDNRNLRPFGFPGVPLGVIQDQRWNNTTLSTDWVNSYDFNLTSKVKVTASAGTQYVNSIVSDAVPFSENFATPSPPTVASGGLKNADENRQRVITGGAFGQSLFGISDRYFVTVGARIDGNSAFGKDFGFQVYPKASASWVVSEEGFWKPALGTLKLRAAYGAAGRAPGAFASVRTFNQVGWGGAVAVRPANFGNPDLGPERTTELELGFDESVLDGRLNVDFTYYKAVTTDAIFNVRSIPSNGFLQNTLKNVGEMEKSGIEASINATLWDRPMLGINAGLNISTNRSEVTSLGGAPSFSVGNFGWVIEGQPAPVVRGKVIRNPDKVLAAGAGVAATDTASNYAFGPSQPTRIIGGSINVRTWKNISIAARAEYQGGHYINEDASFQAISRSVEWPTCFDTYAKRAANQPLTNKETLMCIPANARSDMFIFKGDFFKVRDITVTVPLGRLIPRTSSSSLVFSAQNIFRQNKGMPIFDPEMSGNDGFNATVRYISEHIPAPAVFLSSLRISF